jgi:hypothetical protein
LKQKELLEEDNTSEKKKNPLERMWDISPPQDDDFVKVLELNISMFNSYKYFIGYRDGNVWRENAIVNEELKNNYEGGKTRSIIIDGICGNQMKIYNTKP